MTTTAVFAPATGLAGLEAHAATLETTPGWITREQPIFWAEPRPEARAAHWRYAGIRSALEDAARLVDLSLAERRILALRNPFPGNNFATTRTLSCSYQYMLPGETASTHRHASHALRIMLDAAGTYSIVDRLRMPMETGDIVLTPGGCWHGHGHDGDRPACWMDVLDIPLTHLLEPMYFELWSATAATSRSAEKPGRIQTAERSVDACPWRFSAADIARLLDQVEAAKPLEHGARIVLRAPELPTMGIAVDRLRPGARTDRHRSTASRCITVTAGAGRSRIGTELFDWQFGDTFAIPSWVWYEHESLELSQLVEISDEPVMRMCNYYREEVAA
jgi:gentisate 1,2-dioxygenase